MESEERKEVETAPMCASVDTSSARSKVQRMNWKKIAGFELLKVQSKIVTGCQDKLKDKWGKNKEKTRLERAEQAELDRTLSIEPSDTKPMYNYRVRLNTKMSVFRNILGKTLKAETVTHTLPMIPNLPTSYKYMPSHKNIACDDVKVLQNIPYMGDAIVEHERGFLNELINMHQKKMQCGGGDDTIHDLVDTLFNLEKEKDPAAEEPCQEIFDAISCLLADRGTAATIRDKWNETNLNKSIEHDHSAKLPSIDDPDAVWETQKRDKCLNSFHELICPRCYKYDCMQHTFQYRPAARSYIFKRKLDIPKVPVAPCGEDCFLHIETARERIEALFKVKKVKGKPGRKPKKTTEEPCPDDVISPETSRDGFEQKPVDDDILKIYQLENWTQSDLVLLRSLVEVYQGNFCIISACMASKTCKAIFARVVSDETCISSNSIEEVSSQTPNRKKPVSNVRRKAPVHRKDQSSHNMHNFEPCDHPGEPCTANCMCFQRGNYCEKFCACAADCRNRFSGCNCKGQCNTNLCPCHIARRECDPDICKLCGADDFVKNFDEARCNNIKMQRGLHHHLLMAPSDIAGWGCFAKNDIKKNEYISDYCGELITQEEADRRGKVYDKHKSSFLFDLNSSFCIDATRKGNKIRFANHSMNPNAVTKIIRVNGDHRIGIFAKKPIKKGDELFFDYRYSTTDAIKYVGIERNFDIQHPI